MRAAARLLVALAVAGCARPPAGGEAPEGVRPRAGAPPSAPERRSAGEALARSPRGLERTSEERTAEQRTAEERRSEEQTVEDRTAEPATGVRMTEDPRAERTTEDATASGTGGRNVTGGSTAAKTGPASATGAPPLPPESSTPERPAPEAPRWAAAPADCQLEAPPPADVAPLRFRPCEGDAPLRCARADAAWAEATGWGFGGLLSVRRGAGGQAELAYSRAAAPRVWESIVEREGEVAFALRVRVPASRCMVGGPHLSPHGAAVVVRRAEALSAPRVLVAPTPDALATRPHSLPFTDVMADDVATLGPERVALHAGAGFVVRALGGDAPARSHALARPAFAADGTLWAEGVGARFGTLFRVDGERATPLPPPAAGRQRLRLATGGAQVAWIEATPTEDPARFEARTLVTHEAGAPLEDARRVELGDGPAAPLVLGEGYAALRLSERALLLVELQTGRRTTLEAPPGLAWAGGRTPLALGAGALWARAARAGGPANDGRALFRFALAEAP